MNVDGRGTVAVLAAALMAMSAGTVLAQSPPDKPPAKERRADKSGGLSDADRKFLHEVAVGNMAEVELGRLASERAANEQVKEFGKRMVEDHGKAAKEATELAEKKGVSAPKTLNAKHQQLRDRLAKLSGPEFDRAYIGEMVKDHKKDVAAFKREAARSKDPEIKEWASKTLPTLEEHLKMVQDLEPKVKTGKK